MPSAVARGTALAMADALLTVTHLTLARGLRVLIQDANFSIEPGQAWALRGGNGTGKTTLMRALAGLTKPFAGEIKRTSETRSLTYLGHELALKPTDTAQDLLPKSALEAWDLVQIAVLPLAYLSAGQRKRVALAQRCLPEAALWLFDEPLANLDATYADLARQALAAHVARGGAALWSVHAKQWPGPSLELHAGRVQVHA